MAHACDLFINFVKREILNLTSISPKELSLPKLFSIGACWMGLGGFGVTNTGPAIGSAERKLKKIYY